MLIVRFDNVLVCDVPEPTIYEGKTYYSVRVFDSGNLLRVSLPIEFKDTFNQYIGCYVSFGAELRSYDGKSKFRYHGSEIRCPSKK